MLLSSLITQLPVLRLHLICWTGMQRLFKCVTRLADEPGAVTHKDWSTVKCMS